MNIEFTGEESQADLEAMLSKYEDTQIDDDEEAETSEEEEGAQADETETPEDETAGDTNEAPPPSESADTVILAKDGKNTIPYQVLESERLEKSQAYQKLAELEAQLAEREQREQLLKQQLTSAGVKPIESPDDLKLTPEAMAQMQEEYPVIAESIQRLTAQIEQQRIREAQREAQIQRAEQAEAQAAFQENATLTGWQKNQPDRFNFACKFDELLMNDPAWQGKPVRERYAAVTRATAAHFGDNQPPAAPAADTQSLLNAARDKAQKVLNSNALPDSPSQVGSQAGAPQDPADRLASASTSELYSAFSNMNSAQIEDVLAKAGF